jgi:hypothetical protein
MTLPTIPLGGRLTIWTRTAVLAWVGSCTDVEHTSGLITAGRFQHDHSIAEADSERAASRRANDHNGIAAGATPATRRLRALTALPASMPGYAPAGQEATIGSPYLSAIRMSRIAPVSMR